MFAFFNWYACRPVMTISLLKIMVTSLWPAVVNQRTTRGISFFLKFERLQGVFWHLMVSRTCWIILRARKRIFSLYRGLKKTNYRIISLRTLFSDPRSYTYQIDVQCYRFMQTVQTQIWHSEASDQCLHCLLAECSIKITKWKIPPNIP